MYQMKLLLPTMVDRGNNTRATTLRLSTQLTANTKANSVYNNMTEIIATSNEQGRRMNFSVAGNEMMAMNTSEATDDLRSNRQSTSKRN